MSDEKNDIDTDFEEKLAEIVGKKSRNRTNNNIYERFISRVQGEDDSDSSDAGDLRSLDSAEKLFAYEPLSTNELELFTNQDSYEAVQLEGADKVRADDDFDFLAQETSIPSNLPNKNKLFKNSHLDNLDDDALDFDLDDDIPHSHQTTEPSSTIDTDTDTDTDKVIHELDEHDDRLIPQESLVPPTVQEVVSSQDKLASSKKPLIIGMIFGSLLIAIIVMALIFTGILSMPVQTAVPDITATTSDRNIEAEATTDSTSVNTAPASDPPIDQPITDSSISGNQGAGDGAKAEVANASPATSSVNGTNDVDADLDSGAAITYEDFREESQNTLYRETSD